MKEYNCYIAKYGKEHQLCLQKGNMGLNDIQMCNECKTEYINYLKGDDCYKCN